jgi:hypothetical protein
MSYRAMCVCVVVAMAVACLPGDIEGWLSRNAFPMLQLGKAIYRFS